MKIHICNSIGCQLGDTKIRFSLKRFRFVATKSIDSVFGAEVQGELRGYGLTPKRAILDLAKQEHDHYESLWA